MVATAEKTVQIRGRTGTGINWTGAFLLYTKGSTLQEISDALKIPLAKLMAKFREEDWEGMLKSSREFHLSAPAAGTEAIVLRDAGKRIEQNREDGLAVIQRLRDHIRKILDDADKKEIHLEVSEIRALTQSVTALNTGAMLALGDDPAPKYLPPPVDPNAKPVEDPKKDKRPTMIFNIHMPKIAQQPRGLRGAQAVTEIHAAAPVDAFAARPPMPATIEAVPVESEVVETPNGYASVDFAKLAENSKPAEAPKPASGIPAFFTA